MNFHTQNQISVLSCFKGQIISKCLFGVFNFLQKERKQVDLR
jgi:hypothetical protein